MLLHLFMALASPELPAASVTTVVVQQEVERAMPKRGNTENYLPRRLYPGTYKNYCGPTPEISVGEGCTAHGWHGDDPLDIVDEACRVHDISYCSCETQLFSRKAAARNNGASLLGQQQKEDYSQNSLSSAVALRFATRPVLNKAQRVDEEFLNCIHKADTDLIATGIRIRGEQQRSNCENDPNLGWFCKEGGTLAAFEKVSLSIFLRDLDSDESSTTLSSPGSRGASTLTQLEAKRQGDLLRELKLGKSIREASSTQIVDEDEKEMLQMLESINR